MTRLQQELKDFFQLILHYDVSKLTQLSLFFWFLFLKSTNWENAAGLQNCLSLYSLLLARNKEV